MSPQIPSAWEEVTVSLVNETLAGVDVSVSIRNTLKEGFETIVHDDLSENVNEDDVSPSDGESSPQNPPSINANSTNTDNIDYVVRSTERIWRTIANEYN